MTSTSRRHATLAGQVLLNRCLQVAPTATRSCSTRTTTPAQVSVVSLNLNRLQTSGIDFEVGYRLPLTVFSAAGVLDLRLLATRVIHLKTTDATGASIERAGVNGNNVSGGGAGLPHWQLNGLVNYQQGGLSLSLETRYIQSGLFDSTLIGPEQAGYNVDLPNSSTRTTSLVRSTSISARATGSQVSRTASSRCLARSRTCWTRTRRWRPAIRVQRISCCTTRSEGCSVSVCGWTSESSEARSATRAARASELACGIRCSVAGPGGSAGQPRGTGHRGRRRARDWQLFRLPSTLSGRPGAIPGACQAASARFTENGAVLPLGEGLWNP
jgi:hypothetical protein